MLRTRLWMGSILIGLAVLLLLEDRWFTPWFPIFFVAFTAASFLAIRELISLIPSNQRPDRCLTIGVGLGMVAVNWLPHVPVGVSGSVWPLLAGVLASGILLAFLLEMWRYDGPGNITQRLALTVFAWVYLGLLPSCLAQLRWLPNGWATAALALAVFVPKGNDIGAYFTGKFLAGRVLGRKLMTPKLSPKKTWQGFAGGMLTSVAVVYGIDACLPVFANHLQRVAFALTVGLAGVLGDLAESLIKRDLQTKDASQSVPGFGGVLDVIDSLLFAAPVVWLWFCFLA
ncbi:phosphatidate cytidylyltransferase [Zavarzinella formosa]|uniref:phosphatidate cytidylyltransferase n=1 Tax=Zavarzinella formosa TaxID=360055 RepID=UPI0002D97289|nr:phosphatidate cytidylyltransferase [Zavarzinella formosa]